MKKTKIICTLGPASSDLKILKEMISNGMDCARINLSHGRFIDYEKLITNLRKIKNLTIILDTKGPEVRMYTNNTKIVSKDDLIKIGFTKENDIYFDVDFYNRVKKGNIIYFNDGKLKAKIIFKKKRLLGLKFLCDGVLKNAKSVNINGVFFNLPILHDKDIKGIKFAIKHKIDYIALSFTRSTKDIEQLKKKLKRSDIGVIAKIENRQGLDNFDKILTKSDGVMIARGDLGTEIKPEKIPLIQKKIIEKCNEKGKLVITATQMLQSMINSETPTRAETSDVANAVIDGTDAIMLSAETAIGKYPVNAVKEMRNISLEVENEIKSDIKSLEKISITEAISHSVYEIEKILSIDKIVVLSNSGFTARMISRFRMDKIIIVITPSENVKKKLDLFFGIFSVVYKDMPKNDKILHASRFAYKKKLISKSDLVLFTAGLYSPGRPATNLIEIHRMKDLLAI
ncbi:pyruvate kinase [Candidatus Woesearchaeota archaeon]|nr:pyruvate kinase [Candidatus Woesearchaeota archaeon]